MENSNIADSLGRRSSRADSLVKLVPIEAGYFYPGMYVDFSIYIKMGKTTTLLCSDVALNDALIEKIDAAEDGGHLICVSRDSYKKIILNAARVAEENGAPIDWNGVNHAADNPKTVDEFLAEAEKPAQIEGLENIKLPSGKSRRSIRNQAQAAASAPIPSVVVVGQNGQLVSSEEIQAYETAIVKIDEYCSLGIEIKRFIQSSERNYTVKLQLVNELAEKIVKYVNNTDINVILQSLAALRKDNEYLYSHTQNVACINVVIASWAQMPHSAKLDLATVGLFHDLGKQQISNRIMKKPDKLDANEFNAIKQHSIHSYNIAVASGITNQSVLAGIRHHHERLNGSGYPDKLAGDRIGPYARITAISDIYDAMVSKRPFTSAFSPLDIMHEFSLLRTAELDAKLVNIVLDTLSALFTGKNVILTNGQTGRIVSLNSSDYAHPIVQVGKEYVKTTKYLKVSSFSDFVPPVTTPDQEG